MTMPEPPCELQCPECPWRSWCSEEDPDAGFGAMWNHVRNHTDDPAVHAELLAQVTVVPDA